MHFSLAVFHYPDEDIESLLDPFCEGLEVERYVAYTRQEAIDYARANFQRCKNASDEECWKFMAEDAEETDEAGNIYSTFNPNTRWDWWEEGGRWKGLLKVGDKKVDSAFVKDVDFSESFSTYAVLTPDGEWHEQENTGLFSSDEEWNKHYKERFIDTADPNLMLTIVDCHI